MKSFPQTPSESAPHDKQFKMSDLTCLRLIEHFISVQSYNPASILYESVAGRYRPVRQLAGR